MREVGKTHIRVIQDGCDDPVEYYKTNKNVHLGPPGNHKWIPDPFDGGPVKRQNAHP